LLKITIKRNKLDFIQFKSKMIDFPVFSIADIRTVYPDFDRRRVYEWQIKNYILKVSKGLYIFSDVPLNETMLFRIANKLYRPSYISLETAMAYYQLIPEAVYGVTSVSTRRTYKFNTELATFSYRTVSPHLFFGYSITPDLIKIATVEKTLLDYFYLNPDIDNQKAYESLRIDISALMEQIDRGRLKYQLDRFGSSALSKRITSFLNWMGNA